MSISLLHPVALWLLLPGMALIVFFRLLRNRRQTIDVGSLLIWRKLAALSAPPQKRKFVFDASLALQALALLAVVSALASPLAHPSGQRGRSIFLMIDNGPLSRARGADGSPHINELFSSARELLTNLEKDDRVVLACSAPFPKIIDPKFQSGPEATAMIANLEKTLSPALSGPDANGIHAFVLDRSRTAFSNASVECVVLSMQSDPDPRRDKSSALSWSNVPTAKSSFDNAGIVASGSVVTKSESRQILVRVGNFSDKELRGKLSASAQANGESRALSTQSLSVPARGDLAAVFDIPVAVHDPILVRLEPEKNFNDALPEDNAVLLIPRKTHKPVIRFHSPLPVLEHFFQSAVDAKIINALDSNATASDVPDIDVFVGSVPENLAADVRAALFVAPSKGYRGCFDVGEKSFAWPKARRGDDDPLNADIPAADAGIAISKAYEILRTGDFKTLLQDADTQRALALKFTDEHSRLCVALAFVPNEGMTTERLLDPPLAAMLARFALAAGQSGEPYVVIKTSDVERQTGVPMPMNWGPNDSASGVLDERVSNLRSGARPEMAKSAIETLKAITTQSGTQAAFAADLMPWLAIVASAAAIIEILLVVRKSARQ